MDPARNAFVLRLFEGVISPFEQVGEGIEESGGEDSVLDFKEGLQVCWKGTRQLLPG